MDKSKWSGTSGPPDSQITRRTFVRTGAAAAVGVAAGLDALRAAAPAGQTGPPPLAFDETQQSELLVNPRDIPTSRWRDGDVIQVFSTENALRVHAETIASGRGLYRGEAVPDLRALYDEISNRRRLVPDRADLLWWWGQAEALAGLDRNDFTRYPFTALERRIFLVLPMKVDLTPALRQSWYEGDRLMKYKLSVDWRAAVADTRLATAAAVLDRRTPVQIDVPLPVSIVTAESIPVFEEEN